MPNYPLPSIGFEPVANKVWYNNLIINRGPDESTPAELFSLDPKLPYQGLAQHPDFIDLNWVVIPRGRIVGAVPRTLSATGKALLTFADGNTVKPLGFAFQDIFGRMPHRVTPDPNYFREGYIRLPYIQAVNDAYGMLVEGDYVTAYYGSTTSAKYKAIEDVGKIVKWVEKASYISTTAASGAVILVDATLPGITPRITMGLSASGVAVTGGTVAWDESIHKWVARFGSSVVSVVYNYGQSVDHRVGQVVRLDQVSTAQEADGWLKWVETAWPGYGYGPMYNEYLTTAIVNETPVATSDPYTFSLAHALIAPHKLITVSVISGAVVDNEGNVRDVSGTDLAPHAGTVWQNYTDGEHYRVDFVKGILYIDENLINSDGTPISASNLRIDYSFQASYNQGRVMLTGDGAGIRGLTDGEFTGLRGTPVHLERAAMDRRFVGTAGNFGELRITTCR